MSFFFMLYGSEKKKLFNFLLEHFQFPLSNFLVIIVINSDYVFFFILSFLSITSFSEFLIISMFFRSYQITPRGFVNRHYCKVSLEGSGSNSWGQ